MYKNIIIMYTININIIHTKVRYNITMIYGNKKLNFSNYVKIINKKLHNILSCVKKIK